MRGAIFGLTRNTGPEEIAKAALESVGFQTRDLIEAMNDDWGAKGQTVLRIDGGMANSAYAMQALANQLQAPVDRPEVTETTALGAAYLAGLAVGICGKPAEFAKGWALEYRFQPDIEQAQADEKYAGWQLAVKRLLFKG